jgi:hypothetical protein
MFVYTIGLKLIRFYKNPNSINAAYFNALTLTIFIKYILSFISILT